MKPPRINGPVCSPCSLALRPDMSSCLANLHRRNPSQNEDFLKTQAVRSRAAPDQQIRLTVQSTRFEDAIKAEFPANAGQISIPLWCRSPATTAHRPGGCGVGGDLRHQLSDGRPTGDMRHHGDLRVQPQGWPAARARATARPAPHRTIVPNRARDQYSSTTCFPRPTFMSIAPFGIIAKVRAQKMP